MSNPELRVPVERYDELPLDGKSVTVIGSGIAGVATAVLLQEAGADVRLIATTKPGSVGWDSNEAALEMASAAAGASWKPYHLDFPDPETRDRTLRSSWELCQRFITGGFPGIYMMRHIEASDVGPIDEKSKAYYLNIVGHYGKWPRHSEVPSSAASPVPGDHPYAIWYDTIHFDVATFLPALVQIFEGNGGQFVTLDNHYTSMDEVVALGGDAVVLCVGLGARELVHDEAVHPLTGETLVVNGAVTFREREKPFSMSVETAQSGNTAFFANQYFYYHADTSTTIAGGTNYPGRLDHVRPEAEQYLREGLARNLGARLSALAQVTLRVSSRPEREGGVRVEEDEMYIGADGPSILLHYGHGGAGYTTAFGTADLVVKLLIQRFNRQ